MIQILLMPSVSRGGKLELTWNRVCADLSMVFVLFLFGSILQ